MPSSARNGGNAMYKRPWYVMLCKRYHRSITNGFISTASALLFGMLFVAVLLHIGSADTPGPVECTTESTPHSFLMTDTDTNQEGEPRPLIVASGAGLDLQEVGR